MNKYILVLVVLFSSIYTKLEGGTTFQHLENKKILLMYAVRTSEAKSGTFGSSVYRMQLYKMLLDAGIKVTMLVRSPSFQTECQRLALPYYACQEVDLKKPMTRAQELTYLVQEVLRVCRLEHIDLLHCNVGDDLELEVARKVQQIYPVKVILTLHHEELPKNELLKGLDGVIGVSSHIEVSVCAKNRTARLGIKEITWVAPLFDQTRFTSFVPTEDKKTFFKRNFGVDIMDCPIICMVGIFYKNAQWKNHEILVQAVDTIIKNHGRIVQVVCAGDGPRKKYIQDLVHQLGLDQFIHFLGYTKLIPELLYHSDIKVLTSNQEGFGIALMEGALMKKPLIGTRGTGMENIIEHEKTGLLFNKGDVQGLAENIERLIDQPSFAAGLGVNAYRFMLEHYATQCCLEKVLMVYEKVFSR
ncbi:MAG: glycosyltransferase family 4 protein [Candidatus Babeliales bacterium]